MWDSSHVFEYDPNSTQCAVGVKSGGSQDGKLKFTGTIVIANANEVAVAAEAAPSTDSAVEDDAAARYAAALLVTTVDKGAEIVKPASWPPTEKVYRGTVAWEPNTTPLTIAIGYAAINTVLQVKGLWTKPNSPRMVGGVYQAYYDFGWFHVSDKIDKAIEEIWNAAVLAAGPSAGSLGVEELLQHQASV